MRMPLAASRPINVSQVAATSRDRSDRVAAIRAMTSVGEYRYGSARQLPGPSRMSRPIGGTSVAGSIALMCRAKPRVRHNRLFHQPGPAPAGSIAHRNARSVVIPVSYTHLRAHETRHDLVCRLLLEKK